MEDLSLGHKLISHVLQVMRHRAMDIHAPRVQKVDLVMQTRNVVYLRAVTIVHVGGLLRARQTPHVRRVPLASTKIPL